MRNPLARPTLTLLPLLPLLVAATTNPTSRPAGPPSPDTRVDVTLRKTRWQILPESVRDVYVGPDGRTWYVVALPVTPTTNATIDTAAFKARVEREFKRDAPQVTATPALFEPGGRVWFRHYSRGSDTLLGYDGKQWVERDLQSNHRLVGTAPGHARPNPGASNLFVGGVAFFIDNLGVEQFDGHAWNYRQFSPSPRQRQPSPPLLELEPDGKGVVALALGDTPEVWRWRDGKWTRAADPGPLGRFWRFAPIAGGLLTLTLNGDLRFHPYDPEAPAALNKLLAQLDSADFQTRDRATAELSAMSPAIAPALEKRLAAAQSGESIARLQAILVNLKSNTRPITAVVGPFRVTDVRMLDYLPDRTACVAVGACTDPAGDPAGAGVVLLPPAGEARFLPGEPLAEAFNYGHGSASGPLQVSPTRFWLSPASRLGPKAPAPTPAKLVDFSTGKILLALDDAATAARSLRAVRPDGALFATSGDAGAPVGLYTPGAPDDRLALPTQERVLAGRTVGVGSDGAVYALTALHGVDRFDGNDWKPTGALVDEHALDGALAGNDGVMIVRGRRAAALIAGDKVTPAPTVQALISENADTVRRAFTGVQVRSHINVMLAAVVVDAARNVWLLENDRLSVLAGDRWLDANLALRAAGSPAGLVQFIAPVGTARQVYLTDFSGTPRGISALGEVRDGAIVFTPADRTTERQITALTVRQRDGALWLPITTRIHPTTGASGGRWASRLTDNGVDAEVPGAFPFFCDPDDNVWLGRPQPRSDRVDHFDLWHAGRIVRSLDIPDAGARPLLYADAPGSLWLWNGAALQHLRAKDSAHPTDYQVVQTGYPIPPPPGHPHAQFSRLGYVVLVSENDPTPGSQRVSLVKLPK